MAKYLEIVQWVRERIEQGALQDGDRLETEYTLSERFGVSRQTVRHALHVLEHEGLIEGRQGSGNYIRTGRMSGGDSGKKVILVSTYVNAYIFPNIIQGIEHVLTEKGYELQVLFTYNKFAKERKILEDVLLMQDVAGLIVEPTQSAMPSPNKSFYEELMRREVPILFFHSYYSTIPIPHVSIDDKAAGKAAAEYLIANGHKRIGGIFKVEDGQGHRRFSGYVEALMEAGLPVLDEQIVWIDTEDERNGLKLCQEKVLGRMRQCTACVCYNDSVAYGLSVLCRNAGIRIPEDLSVVSIDNSELARLNPVPLTAMVHPMEALGVRVARQFLELKAHPDRDVTYEFPPELVERNSVCKNKKNT